MQNETKDNNDSKKQNMVIDAEEMSKTEIKVNKKAKKISAAKQKAVERAAKKTRGKEKKADKKTNKAKKDKSTEAIQTEKISKAKIKASEKAAKKASEKEKKAKKASDKAKLMAKSNSKKREKEQTKVEYERRMKREEAVTYFTSLIDGLEKGTIQFKQGKDTVVVTPSDLVDVEIKAQTKGKLQKVSFQLSWLSTTAKDISISSS